MATTAESVIEEIRQSRRRMSEACDHDPAKYIDYLKGLNGKYAAQVKRYREGLGARPAEPAMSK